VKRFVNALIAWGPLGVFLLSVIDSSSIPLPGGVDALVVLLAVQHPESAYSTAAIAVAGSLIGGLILFLIARRGGEAYFERHARSRRGARMKSWFLEYGLLTVFIPALVPLPILPYKIFAIAAGAFQVSPLRYMVVLTVARILRYFSLAWFGKRFGDNTLSYLGHHVWYLVAFAVGLFLVLYLLIKFVDRRRKLREPVSDSE
jgi:membrane protein YqaA with SNARE-associated domain